MDFKKVLQEMTEAAPTAKAQAEVNRWLATEVAEYKAAVAKDDNFYRHLVVNKDNYDAAAVAMADPAVANLLFVETRSEIDDCAYTRCKFSEAAVQKKDCPFRVALLHVKKQPKPTRIAKRMRANFDAGYVGLKEEAYKSDDKSYNRISMDGALEARAAKAEMTRRLAENPTLADVMFVEVRNSAVGDLWIQQPATTFDFDAVGTCDNIMYRFVFGYSTKRAKGN